METTLIKKRKHWFIGVIFMIFALNSVIAQTNGSIKGVISDQETAGFLPEANVILEGTKYHAVTSNGGEYRIYDVLPGTYTLKVSYIGFEDYSAEITLSGSGETVTHSFTMKPSFEMLQEITLKGARFGQSKALNEQKESSNIKNIISEEQIQSFPDLNTAEVLQRVPGVTIQRDMGEGRFVSMRGTSARMTNVLINGEQTAFSNGESRVVELDVISAAQLAGIEVTKVITPDMDANSIGGTVNLKTRSAFDQNKKLLNVTIGGGKSSLAEDGNYRFAFNYAEIYGKNDNFGFSIGGNFARTSRERNNNEGKWGDRDDVNDNEIPMALRNLEVQYSKNKRDRLGLNTQLEYRFNDNNRLYVRGMYNYRWDDQNRQITRVRIDKGDYLSATEVEETRFVKSLNDRLETQQITSFDIGGENHLGKVDLDYNFSSSSAFTKKDDGQLKPEWQMKKVDVLLSNLETKTPDWTVTNDVDTNDGNNYKMDAVDLKYENTTSTINTFSLNLKIPLLIGSNTGDIKFGGKYRVINKERSDLRSKWKWEGDEDLLLSPFETGTNDIYLENGYNLGKNIDREKFRNFFFANQGPNGFEESARNDVNLGEPYDAKENITGAYAMLTQTYGKLLMLIGLRAEFTSLDYTASNLVLDDDEVISNHLENVKRSYNFIFPNAQFRYRASDNTNIRFAYSKGISPPNFFDAMPYSFTQIDDEEIVRGNPYLDPTVSNNFDFLGEHFFKGIGIVSGGVFYKRMNNFIFESKTDEVGGVYDGYEVRQFVNGDGANLIGVEISWQQQFTSLPKFWSGFGVFANYTYTNSSDIDLGPDTDRTEIEALPGQMQNVANASLTYEKGRVNTRLSLNYSGKFLEEVGEDSANDEWRDSSTQLSFSFDYLFGKGFNVFLQLNNMTNEKRYNYIGVATRSREYSITGFSFDIGVKWTL